MLWFLLVSRVVHFVVALVVGLGLVTWVASRIVERQTREWFEKDVNLRAQLAISGARQAQEASTALAAALNMSSEEKRDRMRSMRAFVAEFNVYRWAGRMLVDAARLRSRDRIASRLTSRIAMASNS